MTTSQGVTNIQAEINVNLGRACVQYKPDYIVGGSPSIENVQEQ